MPLKVLGHTLLLIAVLATNGWHVAIVQAYKWADMVHDYHQVFSVVKSIELVLAGQEICGDTIEIDKAHSSLDDLMSLWMQSLKGVALLNQVLSFEWTGNLSFTLTFFNLRNADPGRLFDSPAAPPPKQLV